MLSRLLVLLVLSCASGATLAAETVSRRPSDLYASRVVPQLTPLDTVLARTASRTNTADDGAILLFEIIQIVDTNGHRCIVEHRIQKALTESGVKSIAEDSFSFRKGPQRISLVLAQTIQPDGSRHPIQADAAVLHSPQPDAGDSIYSENGNLTLVFPGVKPGSITESITVIDEDQARIPGEYTHSFSLSFGWPVDTFRRVLELPAALAARLHVTLVGTPPNPERKELPDGFTRIAWTASHLPGRRWEPEHESAQVTGPAVWLTTLGSWSNFSQWYSNTLPTRSVIQEPLRTAAASWRGTTTNREEIAARLLRHVADDVRYTGLEFGAADIVPHDINDVWKNQYGDCKDKANLLRCLLNDAGVPAWIALVNTEHNGRIIKESPDYRQFTHAITVFEGTDGSYIFCDPTIQGATPGLLSPSDVNRDVWLLKGPGEWAHTPATPAGVVDYLLDLKLARDGGLSGWMTVTYEGYYARVQGGALARLSRDDLGERAARMVRSFYPGATTVDFERVLPGATNEATRLRAYFIVPGTDADTERSVTLGFPDLAFLLPDCGTQRERNTAFRLYPDIGRMTMQVELPPALAATDLPRPYSLDSVFLAAKGAWGIGERLATGRIEIETRKDRVEPADFGTLFDGVASLHAWLGRTIPLSPGAGATPAASADNSEALGDFPLMPSAAGQLDLVDARFPASGNPTLRRLALRKTLEYFPSDKTTRFSAGVKMALLDWNDDKQDEAVAQLRTLVASHAADLDADTLAWGRYLLGRLLRLTGDRTAALTEQKQLTGNPALSAYRRGWAWLETAKSLQSNNLTAAIAAAREGLKCESDSAPELRSLIVLSFLQQNKKAELAAEIAALDKLNGNARSETLCELAALVSTTATGDATHREQLLHLLEAQNSATPAGEKAATALREARSALMAENVGLRIQKKLKTQLAAKPGLLPPNPVPATLKTPDDFRTAMEAAVEADNTPLRLRLGVESLLRFPPDPEFSANLWKTAAHAEVWARDTPSGATLMTLLLDACDMLPRSDDSFYEAKFVRVRDAENRGDLPKARQRLTEILALPELPEVFRVSALKRLADAQDASGDPNGALEILKRLEVYRTQYLVSPQLLRAVFLNLARTNRNEALRIAPLLRESAESTKKTFPCQWQITDIVSLASNRTDALRFWDGASNRNPAVVALLEQLSPGITRKKFPAPVMRSLEDEGAELGVRLRSKDRAAVAGMLRLFFDAANYCPEAVLNAAFMCNLLPATFPDVTEAANAATRACLDHFEPGNAALLARRHTISAAFRFDARDFDGVTADLAQLDTLAPVAPALAAAANRLRGALAFEQGKGFSECADRIETDLKDAPGDNERGKSVLLLARLYRRLNRHAEERTLLQAELARPASSVPEADLRQLRDRLAEVDRADRDTGPLQEAFVRLLEKHKPEWYDFARPHTTKELRDSDFEDGRSPSTENSRSHPEQFKAACLIALDPTFPPSQRAKAVESAVTLLYQVQRTQSGARALFADTVGTATWPETLRKTWLSQFLIEDYSDRSPLLLQEQLQTPLAGKITPAFTKLMADLQQFFVASDGSVSNLVAYGNAKLSSDVTPASLELVENTVKRLLDHGAIEEAAALVTRLSTADIAGDSSENLPSLRLSLMKQVNRVRKWQPIHEKARTMMLQHFPATPQTRRLSSTNDFFPERTGCLSDSDRMRLMLRKLDSDCFDREGPTFWWQLLALGTPYPEHRKSARAATFDLMQIIEKANVPDEDAAPVILATAYLIDTDDAPTYAVWHEIASRMAAVPDRPLTRETLQLIDAVNRIRSGEHPNLQALASSLKQPMNIERCQEMQLTVACNTGDMTTVRHLLDTMPAKSLLAPRLISSALSAYNAVGMKEEGEIARERLRETQYQNTIRSWAYLTMDDAMKVAHTALLLEAPETLPTAYVNALAAGRESDQDVLHVRLHSAVLRRNWPEAVAIGQKAVEMFPTFYTFYHLLGRALAESGRREEAISALETYVKHEQNSPMFRAARLRLDQLKSQTPTTP